MDFATISDFMEYAQNWNILRNMTAVFVPFGWGRGNVDGNLCIRDVLVSFEKIT